MFLRPLSSIHFDTSVDDNIRKASKPVLYTLIGVGLFMLLLAVVNFINLATAQFADRTKEIGIRKILGSSRKYLMLQFLLESFVLTLLSVLIVILCLKPILGIFHNYIPEGLVFNWNISNCIFFIALIVTTTLLTGLYPAILLSTYSPVLILKGAKLAAGMAKDGLRKVLIVFQFAVSLVIIFCAIMVGKQLNYMLTRDFGFNADAVIKIDGPMGELSKRKIFAEQLVRLPGVSKVSWQSFPPMGDMSAMIPLQYKGKDEISTVVKLQAADENFLPLYEVRLLSARNLLKSDSIKEFVINQSYANLLGFTNPADAIGKQLYLAIVLIRLLVWLLIFIRVLTGSR